MLLFSRRISSKANSEKGFQTVDLLSGFVTSEGGVNRPSDFLSANFDQRTSFFLGGGVKALAKTDSSDWLDKNIPKYVLLVQLFPQAIRRKLSELCLRPIGQRLVGKFL